MMWKAAQPDRDPSLEKALVLKTIDAIIGPTAQAAKRRPNWRVSPSGATSIFITFSQDSDLFYDVSATDVAAWSVYRRAFVVFVMGSASNALVLPLPVLEARILAKMKSKERGNFKLHITGSTRLHFREVPHVDLDDYRNGFELLSETGIAPPAV